MANKIVITGMGVVSPVGNDLNTFWDNIKNGVSGITVLTDLNHEENKMTTWIGGAAGEVSPHNMDPKEQRRHSRCTVLAVEASNQAIEQAGIDLNKEDPYRCGVILGSGIAGIQTIYENSVKLHETSARRISPLMIPTGIVNAPAGYIGIIHGFQGPNKAIVSACASGTHCIGDAADLIRLGKADVMLAGGTESTLIPFGLGSFSAMRALSTRNDDPTAASRPFDLDRDGFVMGEGAGMVVLESEEHAKARGAEILGELLTLGESCDAFHIAAPREDGTATSMAMKAALSQAKINPEDVGYFNAHGTSTQLNDAGETCALKLTFGDNMPPVSSTKSMTGHLLGAAGAVEAIISLMAIRENVLPPNINYDTPDPKCDVNIVANEAKEAKIAIAMSNSLGFGGHNTSLLIREYA